METTTRKRFTKKQEQEAIYSQWIMEEQRLAEQQQLCIVISNKSIKDLRYIINKS